MTIHPAADEPSVDDILLCLPDDNDWGMLTPATPSVFHVLHMSAQIPMLRKISIKRDSSRADALLSGDRPAKEEAALSGITMPLTSMPVPGRDDVAGKSEHYLFHLDSGKKLTYRTIATGHKHPHGLYMVTEDRPVPSWWPSIKDVRGLTAIVMVPGRKGVDGKSEFYVFHVGSGARLYYRTISVNLDSSRGDALVTADRLVADWWKPSLAGVSRLVEIVLVPGRESVDGKAEFYVFHVGSGARLYYRTISVNLDSSRGDALVTADRLVADWWKPSLAGVSRLVEIVLVPGRESVDGKAEFYVFHRDGGRRLHYRTISIGEDSAHADALVTEDRLVPDWWKASLSGIN